MFTVSLLGGILALSIPVLLIHVFHSMSEANSLVSAACICVALVLAVNAFMHLQRARTLEPLLTVNHDGIPDHASLPAIGFIRWHDVVTFDYITWFGRPYLAVNPTENWLDRTELPPWKRFVRWCKSHPVGFPIMIPLSAMEEVPRDLLDQLPRLRDEADTVGAVPR